MEISTLATCIQAGAAVVSMGMTVVIAFIVHNHTRRRDRLDLHLRRWQIQQDINRTNIMSVENLAADEIITYGKDHNVSIDRARIIHHVFLRLNLMYMMYFGWKEGLITEREFDTWSAITARLLRGSRDIVEHVLEQRGYTDDFSERILKLIDKTATPEPPPGDLFRAPDSKL